MIKTHSWYVLFIQSCFLHKNHAKCTHFRSLNVFKYFISILNDRLQSGMWGFFPPQSNTHHIHAVAKGVITLLKVGSISPSLTGLNGLSMVVYCKYWLFGAAQLSLHSNGAGFCIQCTTVKMTACSVVSMATALVWQLSLPGGADGHLALHVLNVSAPCG